MAILSKGQTFANADAVTSTKLNSLVDAATFVAGSSGTTDDASLEVNGLGRLQVKDGGITAAKLAVDAITTNAIDDNAVTYPKIQQVASMRVIGNTTNATANASEVVVFDEDDMVSDSAVGVPTQQSVKAYVDAEIAANGLTGGQTGTAPFYGMRAWVLFDMTRNASGGSDTANTNRFLLAAGNVSSVTKTGSGAFTVNFTTALPDADYAYSGSGKDNASAGDVLIGRPSTGTKTASAIQLKSLNAGGTETNYSEVSIMFLR